MTAETMLETAIDAMIRDLPPSGNIRVWSVGEAHERLTLRLIGFRYLLEDLARQWGAGWARVPRREVRP